MVSKLAIGLLITIMAVGIDYVAHKTLLENLPPSILPAPFDAPREDQSMVPCGRFPGCTGFPVEDAYYYGVKIAAVFAGFVLGTRRGITNTSPLIVAALGTGLFGLFYGVVRPFIGLPVTLLIGIIHFVAIYLAFIFWQRRLPKTGSAF